MFARCEITLMLSFVYPLLLSMRSIDELLGYPFLIGIPNTGHISGIIISSSLRLNSQLLSKARFLIRFSFILIGNFL